MREIAESDASVTGQIAVELVEGIAANFTPDSAPSPFGRPGMAFAASEASAPENRP